jgi:hypothetical protein
VVVVVDSGRPDVVVVDVAGTQVVVGGAGTTHAGVATGCAFPDPTVTLSGLSPACEQLIWNSTRPLVPVVWGFPL